MAVGIPETRTCMVIGCEKRHVYDTLPNGARIYSNYCQEHTCQAPRHERVPFCINPRGPNNRYCSFHGKCKARECTQQASRSETLPLPYICPRHRCTQCTSLRFGSFRVCEAHLTCQVRGCAKRPDLDHPKLFCRNHSCTMVPRCPHQAVNITNGISHCPHHLPCGVVRGCTRLRMRLPDGRQLPHCEEHAQCQGQGCRFFTRPGMAFCPTHKCSLEGCPRPKDAHSHYCQQHTCFRAGCTQIVYHSSHSGAARFCSAHECAVATCPAEAKTTNGYCENHGCTYESCNAVRTSNSSFCSDHRCRSEGCRHEATDRKGFCQHHVCDKRDCKLQRLGGRERHCLKHYTESMQKRARNEVNHEAYRRQADLEAELQEYERREKIRRAMDIEDERLAMEAELEEEDRRRVRAEAEKLRREEETRRVQEEMLRAQEEERIREAAARMLEDEARERRRADRERQRRQEEADRVAYERAELRRVREREEREREADRKWMEEDRQRRQRQEQAALDASLRERLGRRGMPRDSFFR